MGDSNGVVENGEPPLRKIKVKDVNDASGKMKNRKAVGSDSITINVWK